MNSLRNAQEIAAMFLRESEGVYRFGTKRVLIKIEQDNLVIRVGGGYVSFDEFLKVYGPASAEKFTKAMSADLTKIKQIEAYKSST